jgi:hypothetical protein
MGRRPIRVVIEGTDTAFLTFDTSTGRLWWKQERETSETAFAADGHWYWSHSGSRLWGHARHAVENAWRLHRREQVLKARYRKGHQ